MTQEKLDSWYEPRTEEESLRINKRLAEIPLPIDMSEEEIEEAKLDHLRGDANDADQAELDDYNQSDE